MAALFGAAAFLVALFGAAAFLVALFGAAAFFGAALLVAGLLAVLAAALAIEFQKQGKIKFKTFLNKLLFGNIHHLFPDVDHESQ